MNIIFWIQEEIETHEHLSVFYLTIYLTIFVLLFNWEGGVGGFVANPLGTHGVGHVVVSTLFGPELDTSQPGVFGPDVVEMQVDIVITIGGQAALKLLEKRVDRH